MLCVCPMKCFWNRLWWFQYCQTKHLVTWSFSEHTVFLGSRPWGWTRSSWTWSYSICVSSGSSWSPSGSQTSSKPWNYWWELEWGQSDKTRSPWLPSSSSCRAQGWRPTPSRCTRPWPAGSGKRKDCDLQSQQWRCFYLCGRSAIVILDDLVVEWGSHANRTTWI